MIIARRFTPDKSGFVWACTLVVVSFLATSPKVNIQYTNFLIPLILLSNDFWRTKNVKRNFGLLMISGLIWIICSWFILANYDLGYLGRVYISESYEISPAHVLTAIMGLFGGTRFVALLMDYLNLQKYDTAYISKWNIAMYTAVILVGIAAILPSPAGVILPNCPVRIAIPESADSAFIPGSEQSIDQFLKHYNVTHVVLAFSPDFVNTYEEYEPSQDVTVYFRFKTQPERWTQKDIKWLIDELRSRGIKVLLGVYLKAEGTIYRYSVQGFSVDWVEKHPEVIGYQRLLLFNSTLKLNGDEIRYSRFFSDKIKRIVEDFGFDGVYLMSWDSWKLKHDRLHHLEPLLEDLRTLDKPIFIEGPEVMDYDAISKLLREADYVVLKTAPLIRRLYYAIRDNSSITNYDHDLLRILDNVSDEDRARLLFSAYTFSFVDGWFNPAIELQMEVNKYSEVGFHGGYAIYYADRYSPYKLSIKS